MPSPRKEETLFLCKEMVGLEGCGIDFVLRCAGNIYALVGKVYLL
ncbi:hypothetical protein MCW_01236 [Cardidatus Bartonella washoeensis 085-0475]|uniref:Uncharacterized protein n=1 Tax=Cardidatus Bartonella washoeensis 085-0475 TaxID=1094564 RepID=J0Z9I6_9HYPH|nr:hypothetical protein MCW_01236 [Bartonella washoeensis 085-0475]